MKIEIINQQKVKRVNKKKLESHVKKIFALLDIRSAKIVILLCDNKFIKELNKKFFKKNSVTDVISFPLEDDLEPGYLGDVIVSVEEAVKLSKKYGNKWEKELVLYIIHGILHLTGFDDQTKKQRERMEKKQQEILEKIVS
jgi:probable rRNA maturation factor